MTLTLPDSEFGTRTARRLREDRIAWMTQVDRTGTPQPAPVWFLWDPAEGVALVYNQPTAKRLERIRLNPRTSFHLNDDGAGHDLAVFTGETEVPPVAVPSAADHPAYREKYDDWMTGVFGSPEAFAERFSVPLWFRPTRVRGN